jgi:hypothetical protein
MRVARIFFRFVKDNRKIEIKEFFRLRGQFGHAGQDFVTQKCPYVVSVSLLSFVSVDNFRVVAFDDSQNMNDR